MTMALLPGVVETRNRLALLYAPIGADLAESERIFAGELASRYPFVRRVVERAAALRGKRLRPALVLLTAQACGRVEPAHRVLAAVVEMIHAATLVHDDILDESRVRRHTATVNAEWNNETAVLLGDYLFTHAFHLAASLDSTLACRWIGRATNLVCEGEMMQVHNRGNLDLDEAAYFEIIRGKTAELTAVSCRLGAHYAGADVATVAAMDEYGRELGVAFQIADDVMDLLGDEATTGKTLGTDLEKQKLTLPLIRMMQCSSAEVAGRVRSILDAPGPDSRRQLLPLLEQTDALTYAWEQAEQAAASAQASLELLGPSAARDVLQQMARYVVRRPF